MAQPESKARVPSRTCRICARLSEQEECRECISHGHFYGHLPRDVFMRRPAGQPRMLKRFCSDCGTDLDGELSFLTVKRNES